MPELIERDTRPNANKRPAPTRFKHAANLISGVRLVLAIPLFFFANTPWLFCLLYLLCGLSDALDGFVARRTHTQSELGAKLDSTGDLTFTAVILAVLLGWLGDHLLGLIPWLVVITVVRGVNLVIAANRFRTFAIIHTWANKATGLALFGSPVIYVVWPEVAIFYVVSGLAVLSAVEETAILLTTPKLDLDRPTLFHF